MKLKRIAIALACFCLAALFTTQSSNAIKAHKQASNSQVIINGDPGLKMDAEATQASNDGFSGSVLVAKGGTILLQKGYGLANRESNIPVKTETVFSIGSISKRFTAVAIHLLEQQGKLSINDPITKYFDHVPPDKTGITINHLLRHTSGLGEYHDTKGDFEEMTKAEALEKIFAQQLKFTPGQQEAYSNSGFTLLAMIVEKASGKAFQAFVKDNIFDPCGMTNTGFYGNSQWRDENVARGYNARKIFHQNSPLFWPGVTWALMGAGGIASTPADLYKWHLKLQSTDLLNRESKQRYFASAPAGMAGANEFGFFAIYFNHQNDDAVVIITSNSGSEQKAMGLERRLSSLIINRPASARANQNQPQQTDLTKLSDTIAGQRLLAYVESFNSGDENKVREFTNAHVAKASLAQRPIEDRLAKYREMYPNIRGFKLQRVLDQGPTYITVQARTKTGDTVNINVNLEPNEPHGIVSIMLELRGEGGDNQPGQGPPRRISPPSGDAVPNSNAKSSGTPEAIKQKLDELLTQVSANGFSGAVLVAKDGQIIFNQAYGMADQAKGIANTTETLFDIGSIGKQFTAAAIMKLEMLGKLSTNDAISKYLDGVPTDKQAITIHQLLTMTSGIQSSLMMKFRNGEPSTLNDKTARIKELLNAPLELPPGKGFKYSNGGYNLLAAIVEKASGQTYEQFVHENLFKPAGMKSTAFESSTYKIPDWEKKTVAHVYTGDTDNGIPNASTWFVRGPGGIFTTTGDLYKWHVALMDNIVLSAEAKKKLYTPVFNNYACGWDAIPTTRGLLIQHNGGTTMGTSAEFRRYVDAGIVTIVLGNKTYQGRPAISAIREELEAITFAGNPPNEIRAAEKPLNDESGLIQSSEGRVIAAFLEAYKSGDEIQIKAFLDNRVQPAVQNGRAEEIKKRLAQIRNEAGQTKFQQFTKLDPDHYQVLLKNNNGKLVKFIFEFRPMPPNDLINITAELVNAP